jgi:hypothetical protein
VTGAGYELRPGIAGPRLRLLGGWRDEFAELVQSGDVVEIEANYAFGWDGDLSFVSRVPELRGLLVFDWTLEEISVVHRLHELRVLELHTYDRGELDFAAFPRLEVCSLHWRPGAASLFGAVSLRELAVESFNRRSLDPFAKLGALRSLSVSNGPAPALGRVADLENLRVLRLRGMRKLRDLQGIERLTRLEELDLSEAPIGDLGPLRHLTQLRRLQLSDVGSLESLAPLAALPLEALLFDGDVDVRDGDLTPLLEIAPLRTVGFMEREHYNRRRADFAERGIR